MKQAVKDLIADIFSAEMLRYMLVGVFTFIIDIGTFQLVFSLAKVSPFAKTTLGHIISWFFSTTFSFFLNKYYVFKCQNTAKKHFWYEAGSFYGVRLVSLIISYFLLLLLINVSGIPSFWSKLIVNVFVVVFNYIFAKLLIFKRKDVIKQQIKKIENEI